MNRSVIEVDTSNFEREVIGSGAPVLVDFWAPWCLPCRMMAPVIDEFAEEKGGKIKVAKVNIDENQELAMAFDIMSIPTLGLFNKGSLVGKIVGFLQKAELERQVSRIIG